jgi:hypothetical protein
MVAGVVALVVANRVVCSAAVIGHGRSPVGRGWGSRIDACDLVVRMWDNHWQDEADWGFVTILGITR